MVCEFLGERKLANTRKIVRLARDFDRQGGFTLAEFVARLRADLENEPREEQAATTDEAGASIRLMSIHQAKGLEFPIVVLPDLARTSRSQSPLVACRPDLGLVVRPPQAATTPGAGPADTEPRDPVWKAYLTLERIDDEQESLRLFYVAATRARDALILSAGLGPDEPVKSTSVAMRLIDERFDRRDGSCLVPPAPDDPVPPPEVRVHLMSPPAPRGEAVSDADAAASAPPPGDAPSPRLSISAIEQAITRAGPPLRDEPVRMIAPPRYVDLDPAWGLSPRVARLDALVRSIVRDPQWRRREAPALEALAAHAGARQVPAASPGLIRDAVRRLDALWGLTSFRASARRPPAPMPTSATIWNSPSRGTKPMPGERMHGRRRCSTAPSTWRSGTARATGTSSSSPTRRPARRTIGCASSSRRRRRRPAASGRSRAAGSCGTAPTARRMKRPSPNSMIRRSGEPWRSCCSFESRSRGHIDQSRRTSAGVASVLRLDATSTATCFRA